MEQVFTADKKQDELILPGFRFHPTDEELVGFYLRRKVGRKPLSVELIREVDIYKYNPWDLPTFLADMSSVGEKEWYFFCIRVRKYRNSVRPNRVTDSGFWKATGIDKPIYSSGQTHHECIGLKKTLVFYRGAAGKGTKTEWMMHEFRLPPSCKNANQSNPKNTFHEAEVWTLCRVFKKIHSYKRHKSEWKNSSTAERFADTVTSKPCSLESESSNQYSNSEDFAHRQKMNVALIMHMNPKNHNFLAGEQISAAHDQSSYSSSNATLWDLRGDEFFKDRNWDELRSVVDLASDPSNIYHGS